MTDRLKLRVPPRLVVHVQASSDWANYRDGRRLILTTDLPWFRSIDRATPRADGSLVVDIDISGKSAAEWWAQDLRDRKEEHLTEHYANVRSANAVLKALAKLTR